MLRELNEAQPLRRSEQMNDLVFRIADRAAFTVVSLEDLLTNSTQFSLSLSLDKENELVFRIADRESLAVVSCVAHHSLTQQSSASML